MSSENISCNTIENLCVVISTFQNFQLTSNCQIYHSLEFFGISFYFVVFSFHTSFWPGSFFYIVTLLPAIWVAELKILDEKVQNGADTCESNALSYNHEVGNGLVCSLH